MVLESNGYGVREESEEEKADIEAINVQLWV
jgi:hypothetical protein